MTLAGIDFGGKAQAARVAVVIVWETLAAAIGFVLLVYGPLWPVGRLHLLNTDDGSLAAEGIDNPDAQRMFCWVALCCILTLVVCVWLGQGTPKWHAAELMAGGLYLMLTYVVFEWSIIAFLKEAGTWVVIILLGLAVWLVLVAEHIGLVADNTSRCSTPEDQKTKAFTILTIVTAASFTFAGIYLALEATWCSLFTCH